MQRLKSARVLAVCVLVLVAGRATGTVPDSRSQAKLSEPLKLASVSEQGLTLRVEALETVWIVVESDGRSAFQGVLSPSETATAKAHQALDVTVGNAQGAIFSLNGEKLESIGGPGEVKTVHATLRANTPFVDVRSPLQASAGPQDRAAGSGNAQPVVCEALSQKVHQARADDGESLEAAWNAVVAERDRKHASVWEDACVVSTLAGIQGLRPEALEARHIPVEPDLAYMQAGDEIRAIDSEILKTPAAEPDVLESLRRLRATLEALQAQLLPNLIKVEVLKPSGDAANRSWQPAATIINRSSILPLSRISVPLQVYDRGRNLIWQGSFGLDRLQAGGKAAILATGAPLPRHADATFFKVGSVRLSVE